MIKQFIPSLFVACTLGCLSGCFCPDRGNPVRTAWESGGRAAALTWFREKMFGVPPVGRPTDETFGPRSVSMADGKIKIDIFLALPKGASREHPVPVFIMGDHSCASTPPFAKKVYADIPTNAITARGYAYVCWNFNDVAPNTMRGKWLDRWSEGVYQVYGGAKRTPSSWGTIAAWAWGHSRVLDWIERQPELDAKRVAVVGHSRGGKTALWAAAQDERFAMGVSNNSGCGGAKLNAMDLPESESIDRILYNFPFWFCENWARYRKHDAEVERDADDLMRLVAPRLLYVASAAGDAWAGPKGEFEAARRASDLWRAYGDKGLSLTAFPPPETVDHGGRIGYHLRSGPHKLMPSDWERFMDFADQHMK